MACNMTALDVASVGRFRLHKDGQGRKRVKGCNGILAIRQSHRDSQ